ncbi:cyclic AMP-responsive element-binding protein 1 isoform X1 [Acyrthosiphon pisum]|uniref:Cyclic AMP-responsive element-binding protein 1 n=1 Tax=Acyrthosiphon pisum TaxID=7029 RepID=A0A8R2B8V4_ACYPI|nr:cyclic AMP-responsive element-binding protein 1 isoform X1 [Acyrthosiphon pisum]|eukprot:XP_008186705.1 PREDICTED: cyclic AMP-responsive element-binding protein 1 isoform X1 [Acyrthosiphon pisum]
MDGMVEENGTGGSVDALVSQGTGSPIVVTSVHSVIQANQQSVIQTATQGTMLTKGNVILLSKPNSVIQTPQGNIQTLQVVVEAGSDESLSANEDSPKRIRHDALTRRPSYRKILNDIAGGKVESSGSDCDSNLDSELSSNSLSAHYQTVPPAMQLSSQGEMHNIPTLTMSNATSTGGGTILQYASQDGQFFVPVVTQGGSSTLNTSSLVPEDQVKKREMRLLKNREAARECRRKKKEYIKCLENRVSVLENQNKALIEELKALKELYCQTKTE